MGPDKQRAEGTEGLSSFGEDIDETSRHLKSKDVHQALEDLPLEARKERASKQSPSRTASYHEEKD